MKGFCPKCEAEREFVKTQREETYPVKGEPITIMANVLTCGTCGTDVFDETLDSENLSLAYSQYRKQKGLLGPEEIKKIRERYGLSQRGLAALLGWSPATIARYELGSIPSVAHNDQLCRFSKDVAYARSLFEASAPKLGNLERKRVQKALGSHRADSVPEKILRILLGLYSRHGESLRGRRRPDLDRLAEMAVFFAAKCPGIAKSKLLKMLWYSDFLCYRRTLCSMSGAVYCHNYFGPIPLAHDLVMAYMERMQFIALKPQSYGEVEGERVEPLVEFEADLFSPEELKVLEDVLRKFKACSATALGKMSHKERGYTETQLGEPIPYEYAMTLKAIE